MFSCHFAIPQKCYKDFYFYTPEKGIEVFPEGIEIETFITFSRDCKMT